MRGGGCSRLAGGAACLGGISGFAGASPLAGRAALRACGRDVRPAAHLFSLLCQRKLVKKGDPTSAPLAARGVRCGARGPGRVQKLAPAGLRQSALDVALRAPQPRPAALLAAAHGEGKESRLAAHRLGLGRRVAALAPARDRDVETGCGEPGGRPRASVARAECRRRRRPLRGVRRCAPVAGMCARRRTYFLCFAKESRQRKATRRRRPSLARGVRCGARGAGRVQKLAPAGLEQSALDVALRAPRPRPAALLAAAHGEGNNTLGSLRIASAAARRCARAGSAGCGGSAAEAMRSEPKGFGPSRMRRRGAQGRGGRGAQRRRAQLSEPPQGASSAPAPANRAPQGTPRSGAPHPGRLSLVPFFGETKKGTAPPGAHPGHRRAAPHAPPGANLPGRSGHVSPGTSPDPGASGPSAATAATAAS